MSPPKFLTIPLVNLLLIASLFAPREVSADITIDGFTPESNDRFTNSGQFIASGYDLSGIGQTSIGQWATLISPNVVVSAFHFIPGNPIVFHSNNNPGSPSFSYSVINSARIGGNSDIWIAQLNSPVDPLITPFQIATEILSGLSPNPNIRITPAGVHQDVIGFMVGRSPVQQDAMQDQAFGQNRISGYAQDVAFNGGIANALALFNDAPANSNFVPFEALVRAGDSGAPFLVPSSLTSLRLFGINSFQFTDVNNLPIASGISYLGNSAQEIQTFISVSAVPEPSTCGLLVVAIGVFLLRKRLKKATVSIP